MGVIDFIYDSINGNSGQIPQNMDGMQNYGIMQDPYMGQDTYMQQGMMPDPYMQQGMMQPMNQFAGQMYPQMGQSYGIPNVHYSKAEILEGLKYYIANSTGIMVTRVVKLEDYPQFVKHACVNGKIQRLQPNTFTVPEAGISFQYWFCMYCGKLFLLKDAF